MHQDSSLIRKIKAALTAEGGFDLRQTPIAVTSRDGVVMLRGHVDRLRDKRRAEAIVAALPGVLELRSSLRLFPVIEKADPEIAQAARNALDQDRNVDGRGIEISVADGVVILRGTVPTAMQRRVAVATMWWLPFVQDVRDELRVPSPDEESDEALADACHIMLAKDPLVEEAAVFVRAENGYIILAGTARSAEERDAAENTIWGLPGVIGVRSHIAVVPSALPLRERETGA